jgi:hypothetical protein
LSFLFVLSLSYCKKSPITPDAENLIHPVIWLSVFELSFSAFDAGANPSPQVLKIKNSGQSILDYTISDNAEWMSVEPANGSSSGQLVEHSILIDKSNLAAQEANYSATIIITCAEAYNNPQKVSVSLKIRKEPPPEIWVSPSEFNVTAKLGSNSPPQSLRVRNSGKGTLSYTISTDSSWLAVNPSSGTSSGEEKLHNVIIDITGLAEGNYSGFITIADPNASNSPQKAKVNLKVSKEPLPEIAVSPTQFTFKTTAGQNPSSQSLGISNGGGGTLNYAITWNANWLTVSPASGSSSGQQNSHTVAVNAGGLGVGTYSGTITISDPKASNNPKQVVVTLEVGGIPTDNEISISCNPNSGGADTTVTVSLSIKGNIKDISVFGLDFSFDSNLFQYQSVGKGSLNGDWAAVDGNMISTGNLRIGGFAGSGAPVPKGSIGTIAVVTLKVTGTGYNDGHQSQISITSYMDDVAGMKPEPSQTVFTYRK